jgi:heat shock protein HslJ
LTLLLGACAAAPDRSTQVLPGTSWQLVAIQSMDDAHVTTRIAAPQRYTVSFGGEGRATFRIDCNHGTGIWLATPAAGDVGSLTFGPVAMTRIMCPPGSHEEKVMRDLPYVRSYLIKDGKLFMSLMADGGIYEWLPQPQGEENP